MNEKEQKEFHEMLPHFYGTEHYYKLGFPSTAIITDGVKYVAEKVGAYWLFQDIDLYIKFNPKIKKEEFVIWKLIIKEDSTATLTAYRDYDKDNSKTKNFKSYGLKKFDIPFTDFKSSTGLSDFTIYSSNTDRLIIFLPSEY